MNTCYDRHEPKYKIKYKPTRPGGTHYVWLVCEKCFGKPEFFGSINEVESIISLEHSQEIKFKIEHISLMTEKIGEKNLKSSKNSSTLKLPFNSIYKYNLHVENLCQ